MKKIIALTLIIFKLQTLSANLFWPYTNDSLIKKQIFNYCNTKKFMLNVLTKDMQCLQRIKYKRYLKKKYVINDTFRYRVSSYSIPLSTEIDFVNVHPDSIIMIYKDTLTQLEYYSLLNPKIKIDTTLSNYSTDSTSEILLIYYRLSRNVISVYTYGESSKNYNEKLGQFVGFGGTRKEIRFYLRNDEIADVEIINCVIN